MNTVFDMFMKAAKFACLKAEAIKIMQSDLSREEKRIRLIPLKKQLKNIKKSLSTKWNQLQTFKEMTIDVSLTVIVPKTKVEPTQIQIEEWLRFSFGDIASMSAKNPLVEEEPEIDYMTVGYLIK